MFVIEFRIISYVELSIFICYINFHLLIVYHFCRLKCQEGI